jgi:serine/threonine protein kinase
VTQQIDEMPPMATLDGRYRLLEVVGHAGAARLYRAEDTLLGRPVAIKMMRGDANVLASPERLRNEANVLSSLAHPALVTLLDAHQAPVSPATWCWSSSRAPHSLSG